MSMNRTWAISSWISFLISVDIGRMRLGIERDCSDKDRRNPLGPVIGGHDCRVDVDDEPANHYVAQCDAIDLPLFQFTEERAHLSSLVAYAVSAIQRIRSSLDSAVRSFSRLCTRVCARMSSFLLAPLKQNRIRELSRFRQVKCAEFERLCKAQKSLKLQF